MRRNFIARNDGFVCEACQQTVPPAPGTSRNHCSHCLTSKHVDANVPGDRAATCGGLMPPVAYEGTNPAALRVTQQCQRCGKRHRNRLSPDDVWQTALTLPLA